MNNKSRAVEIEEFRSQVIDGLSEEDIAYLQKECFKYNRKKPSLSSYRLSKRVKDSKLRIENTSYSGIIQLSDTRLYFSTKVKTNLFYMLSFLKHHDSFCYDPEVIIDIEEGGLFFDVIGRLFLNELDEIIKRGFYKKYENKEENIAFLKGKILFKKQQKNDYSKKSKFFCSYEDLTYDNLENRIILKAATLLIPLIKFNEEVKQELIYFTNLMREEIDLVNVAPRDCGKIQFNKLNDYYETIIGLSRIILQNYFIRSVYKGASKGFNFVVNMNKVYEDFLTTLIEEVIAEDTFFADYVVESQERFNRLVKEKRIITKPDIILKRVHASDYPLIIDAKYKTRSSNADFYQVIAYGLAIPSAKACCLFYPDSGNMSEECLTLDTSSWGNQRRIKLHTRTIDLLLDEDLSFKEYIEKIKAQIKSKLRNLFEE